MLTTSGQGVIVDALLALRFECTHDDFDLCRMRKVESPYLIELDVTFQLVHDGSRPATGAQATELTPDLAWLSHHLSKVDCMLVSVDQEDGSAATFARQNTFRMPRLGSDMTARVYVRARGRRAD